MEVFFFLIYHDNTAPQKAGGQDTHSDCKSPKHVWRLKLWVQPGVPLPAFLIPVLPRGPQPWCVCVSKVGSRHRHSSVWPHISPGLPQELCPFAARLEETENKPGASKHTWYVELGAAPWHRGRKDTQPQDPAVPMARATLQLFLHEGFLLSPWPGTAAMACAPSDSSDGRGCFSVPREEPEPFWQLYKHTSSHTCSSQDRQNLPTWKGNLLGLMGHMKMISRCCLVSASLRQTRSRFRSADTGGDVHWERSLGCPPGKASSHQIL